MFDTEPNCLTAKDWSRVRGRFVHSLRRLVLFASFIGHLASTDKACLQKIPFETKDRLEAILKPEDLDRRLG